VIACLIAGKPLKPLGVGEHDGRIDLRGLPAAPTPIGSRTKAGRFNVQSVRGRVSITGVRLAALDLSGALLDGWRLRDTQIRDCRFDAATCRQWVLWDSLVEDATFDSADLRDSSLGTAPYSYNVRWSRVSYRGADLRSAHASCGTFDGCSFDNARFGDTDFRQCTFTKCHFEGPMVGVRFDGRDLSPDYPAPPDMEADFSGAYFSNVEFDGFALANITLPRDDELTLTPRAACVARWVIDHIGEGQDVPSRQLRGVMEHRLKGLSASASSPFAAATIENRRDWRSWGGVELENLARGMILRAQSACSDSDTP
jgi:uncharacterized protein YjbI with pentapeptide repeats